MPIFSDYVSEVYQEVDGAEYGFFTEAVHIFDPTQGQRVTVYASYGRGYEEFEFKGQVVILKKHTDITTEDLVSAVRSLIVGK